MWGVLRHLNRVATVCRETDVERKKSPRHLCQGVFELAFTSLYATTANKRMATILMILIIGLMAGPAVSL